MEDETTKEKERIIDWKNVATADGDLPKVKPRFNRKKIFTFILFFIVAAFLLASIYGFYCFFTSATNFLGVFPNFFLKESVHNLIYSNILSSAFALTITGIVGFIGVIGLACFISRCFSIYYKEFDWCMVIKYPNITNELEKETLMGYCLPECIMYEGDDTNRGNITIFGKMRAFLSGMKSYRFYDPLPGTRPDDSEPSSSSSSDTHEYYSE
jgi:hypothetical protein